MAWMALHFHLKQMKYDFKLQAELDYPIRTKLLKVPPPLLMPWSHSPACVVSPAWLSCFISCHSSPQFLCLATQLFFSSSSKPD